MKLFLWMMLISVLFSSNIFAANVKCTGGKLLENVTLPVQNLSVTSSGSGNPSAYSKLATWSFFRYGGGAECWPSPGITMQTRGYVEPYNGKQPKLSDEGQWIFPTSQEGIGISFKVAMGNSPSPSMPIGTSADSAMLNGGGVTGYYHWTSISDNGLTVEATLWKMPATDGGANLPVNGQIQFSGPTTYVVLVVPAGSSLTPTPPNNGTAAYPNSWVIMSKQFDGSLTVYPGTCNFAHKTVQMGKHDAGGATSDWHDASFTLQCPKAYGYNSAYSIKSDNTINGTASNTPNKGLVLTVLPRTNEVGSNNGVIELDSSSTATGFGIQLAWGGTSQSTGASPASPVKFNQPVNPGSISQTGYITKSYSSGSTPTTEIINMAARYIRTTGTTSAGTANSAVEIVASYN